MSACAMLSYNNVTPAAWQCAVQAAKAYGVNITSNSGSATVSGFTIQWNYNPSNSTATVQCTDSPFWAPCSVINSKLNDAVEACLTQNQITMTAMVEA